MTEADQCVSLLQHYKASLTATFNLHPVSTPDEQRPGMNSVRTLFTGLLVSRCLMTLHVLFTFFQDANFAIVLEEDLDISIDFFRYVLQKAQPLLRTNRN